jgi:hypothetical protein
LCTGFEVAKSRFSLTLKLPKIMNFSTTSGVFFP